LRRKKYYENRNTKKKISEITAVAAMILLLTYLVDAAIGQDEIRFLPMNEKLFPC